ncbi:hypothetical protein B0T16DRAFT_513324 [Cercophora newfieldiana]|uniref:SGNH hydrolase-type esterase domain-containing protein n=1 Tax=Cercophora newfieldiana TaxID=92897 RepID=A0AA40CMH9_9PEZI|nr:hypothetical protein B0T16DRAFT_513324 [Cercophora newfieldiana]
MADDYSNKKRKLNGHDHGNRSQRDDSGNDSQAEAERKKEQQELADAEQVVRSREGSNGIDINALDLRGSGKMDPWISARVNSPTCETASSSSFYVKRSSDQIKPTYLRKNSPKMDADFDITQPGVCQSEPVPCLLTDKSENLQPGETVVNLIRASQVQEGPDLTALGLGHRLQSQEYVRDGHPPIRLAGKLQRPHVPHAVHQNELAGGRVVGLLLRNPQDEMINVEQPPIETWDEADALIHQENKSTVSRFVSAAISTLQLGVTSDRSVEGLLPVCLDKLEQDGTTKPRVGEVVANSKCLALNCDCRYEEISPQFHLSSNNIWARRLAQPSYNMILTSIITYLFFLMRIVFTLIQGAAAIPRRPPEVSASPQDTIECAVLGDSWASGVAYNRTNVYGPTDTETCYRIKKAWGVQMYEDKSWTLGDQTFNVAACGGSKMAAIKKQFEQSGTPRIVWAMFGGNDAGPNEDSFACVMKGFAKGLTKVIRDSGFNQYGLNGNNTLMVGGEATIPVTFIRVQWEWILLPAVVWTFCFITWAVIAIQTRRLQLPKWRDDLLPLVFLHRGGGSQQGASTGGEVAEELLKSDGYSGWAYGAVAGQITVQLHKPSDEIGSSMWLA